MKNVIFLSVGIAAFLAQSASAVLIESFENTLDGWQVPSPFGTQTGFSTSFSSTTGVTAGSFSLAITGSTSSPNYSQMMISPSTTLLTSELGDASSLSLDIFAPSGSFGGFLQFDVDINNNDTGFVSLDGFSYPATTLGAEDTLTYNIPSSLAATLAASSNPTAIIVQVGGGLSAGNETFYVDNIQTTAVPEPTTVSLVGVGMAGLMWLRRRQS